jgi:hypothetical protein
MLLTFCSLCIKYKVNKSVPLLTMQVLRGRGGIQFLFILDLGTRWGEWSASCSDCALPPGKGPRYPFDRRLGGPRSWSGR